MIPGMDDNWGRVICVVAQLLGGAVPVFRISGSHSQDFAVATVCADTSIHCGRRVGSGV